MQILSNLKHPPSPYTGRSPLVKRRKDRKPMDFNSSKFLAVLLFNPDPTSNVATQIRLLEICFSILEHIMTRTVIFYDKGLRIQSCWPGVSLRVSTPKRYEYVRQHLQIHQGSASSIILPLASANVSLSSIRYRHNWISFANAL